LFGCNDLPLSFKVLNGILLCVLLLLQTPGFQDPLLYGSIGVPEVIVSDVPWN
jgi:hypothetical protein